MEKINPDVGRTSDAAWFSETDDPKVLDRRREAIREGYCPVCEAGPYKMVLNHVAKKHGIERREMRELCGLTYTESACDPEVSESARQRWHSRPEMSPKGKKRTKKNMSPEGRRRAGERIAKWAEENPKDAQAVRSASGKKNTEARWGHLPPNTCATCGTEIPRSWKRCPDCRPKRELRWKLVLDCYDNGMTDKQIGDLLGITRRSANKLRHTAQRARNDGRLQGLEN